MGKWIAALAEQPAAKTPASHYRGTDKADKRGVLSVLTVMDEGDVEKFPAATDPTRACACADCTHLLPRSTCAIPLKARLIPEAEGVGIAWLHEGHAAEGEALEGGPAAPMPPERPYILTHAEADAAHAKAWSGEQIASFETRREAIQRRGFSSDNAEDLAERLHLRDVQGDDRALCLECRHLRGTTATGRRCGNHRIAEAPRNLPGDLVTLLQRCPAFSKESA